MKAKYTRLFVLLAALLLVVSAVGVTAFAVEAAPADEPVCYDHGDVNSDGDVTGDDAVYLLFASFGDLFGEQFQLTQDGDLDGNGQLDGDDAVYLLFASFDMFKDQYPLKGLVHDYYEPIWTWDTTTAVPTAQLSLKCGCGFPHNITEAIVVTPGTVNAPTCVATGSKEFTANVVHDGKEFTNTVTVTVDAIGASGHEFNGTPTCTSGVKCENCDYVQPKLDHSYQLMDTEKVEGCMHTKRYKCSACQEEIDGTAEGDVYYTHSYTARIETEATCSSKGLKIYTCTCGDSYSEDINENDSHTWVEVSKDNHITTYNCACGAIKDVVEAAADGSVSTDGLENKEVQLKDGTSVALDEATANQLNSKNTIKITVNAVKAHEVQLEGGHELSSEEKQQIGQNDIYDFSMTDANDNPISDFNGYITVTLPYTPQLDDDVNSIDVWFIADNGSVECVKGVYSNGAVTFQTNHFSYYTVTRLTPAQRCTVYGHVEVTTSKAATCTEDGYTKTYCQRCGNVSSQDTIPMLTHNYTVDTEKSKDATCDAAGLKVEVCQRCSHEKSAELKQLSHDWEKTETVAPDCTSKGHDKHTCKLCQKEKTDNEKEATGHAWAVAENGWQWSSDYSKATVTLVCTRETHKTPHTKVLTAAITKEMENSVCVGGEVTYKAKASFNKETYENTVTGNQTGLGHAPDSQWEHDSNKHYHLCAVCKEKVGEASHDWERTVITPASCNKSGTATDKCVICDFVVENVTIPATGEHNLVNGVCSQCGYTDGTCDHMTLTEKNIDLSQYGMCAGTFTQRSCACGKIYVVADSDLSCDMETVKDEYNEELERYEYKAVCKNCGAVTEGAELSEHYPDTCEYAYIAVSKLIKDDQVLIEAKQYYEKRSHPAAVKKEIIDLADYGMCAGTCVHYTCYCGERSYYELEDGGSCNWVMGDGYWEATCSICGTLRKLDGDYSEIGCQQIESTTCTFSKNGVELLSYTSRFIYENHDYRGHANKMYGETCSDGVCIKLICARCGDTEVVYEDWCYPQIQKQEIDTTGTGFCTDSIVIFTCPCGAEGTYELIGEGSHSFTSAGVDKETGLEYRICEKCDYTEETKLTVSEKNADCVVVTTKEIRFSDENGHNFVFTYSYKNIEHDMVYDTVLAGNTCKDGVTISETCKDCDYSYSWSSTDHYTYVEQTLDLSAHSSCGTLVFTQYRCACGYNAYVNASTDLCSWSYYKYENTENGYTQWYRCDNCGIVQEEHVEYTESADPCKNTYTRTIRFSKDEQPLGEITYDEWDENHSNVYRLTLNDGAEDCNGGWSGIGTCTICGKTTNTFGYSCQPQLVAREVVSTEEMCGQLEKLTYRCACGKNTRTGVEWADENTCCQMVHQGYDNNLKAEVETCKICGASRLSQRYEESVEGTTCQYRLVEKCTWLNNAGDVLVEYSNSWTNYSHNYLYTFTLKGQTCSDGYDYTGLCLDCNATTSGNASVSSCDPHNLVGRELVYSNDTLCGDIYINHYSCACGAEERYSCDAEDHSFTWKNGNSVCDTCGLVRITRELYDRIPGTCRTIVTREETFLLNGETVATAEMTWEQTQHIYLHTYHLNGDSCEDGYTYSERCAYCDYSWNSSYVHYDHNNWMTEYYELPESSCGGNISVYACACGQESHMEYNLQCNYTYHSSSKTDENGIVHNFYERHCSTCGLTVLNEDYQLPGEDVCHYRYYDNYTFRLGDWEKTFNLQEVRDSHDYETISQALDPDAADCEDGVNLVLRCKVCGYETTGYTHQHNTDTLVTSIDLGQYGSNCGAALNLMKCACGKHQEYRFSDETLCDLDKKETDHWIEGVLDIEQRTSQGYVQTYSYSYIYTCAVTDPACGLKIRMSRYWLNENCSAVQYETWQLGYDPATGTCQKEITIATGERHGYHPYVRTEFDETVDGKRVYGARCVCPDCGSAYTYTYYHDADGKEIKYVTEAVNTKDNGENKKYTETYEYAYYFDMQYTVMARDEYVYADGRTWWYQNAYTYDFTNGCHQTRVHTTSNGDNYTYAEEAGHRGTWIREDVKEPTCTQFGKYIERYTCVVCGTVTSEHEYDREPTAHFWNWSDEKQTFVCSGCGLESQNGASGSIVMEDLTGAYTEGNYVIGYWNRGEVDFEPYVSLILYDVEEGENDELVLSGIDFTYLTVKDDGICGLEFSQEAVATAAAAAIQEAGYTGTYAVRISFVPLNSTDTLDYAITFETLTAE